MTISTQAHALLEQLVATGLYGATVEQVIEGLICEQLKQLIKDGVVIQPQPSISIGPRCPRCGSTRLNELKAMGFDQLQCLDCDLQWGRDP